MKTIYLSLILAWISFFSAYSQDITGKWYGRANIGAMKLRIEFNIQTNGDGYSATMLSPDQSSQEIPVTSIQWKDSTLTLSIASIGFEYTGKQIATDKLEGVFTQMGSLFKLNLGRDEELANRPQNPRPPFPYQEEKITFESPKNGIKLAGTLTFPATGKNFTAVILVSGSGPQNRDEEIMEHRPFAVLADYLTQRGIAVLRYDDRGVGESEGNYATATLADFASDTQAAIEYLKSRKEIDKEKIGIIGHSEGGAIAFILASQQIPAFIVSLAGAGVPGRELMNLQRAALLNASGISDYVIEINNRIIDEASALAMSISDKDELKEKITSLTQGTLLSGQENNLISQLTSSEMLSILRFDPAKLYPTIQCPVLALNGEKDLQVTAEENIRSIENGLRSAGNKKVETKIYPDLNHLFQTAKTGLPTEYGQIEETISPLVLEDIADWLQKQ